MATTAETMVAFLLGAGVRRIYGAPAGGGTLDLIEAGRQRQIEFLPTLDEAGAAVMAATEGDLLDRPGICMAALGPGAASAVHGVARAFLDRTPLIVVTDRASRASRRLAPRQGLDHRRLFEGVTKGSATITAPRAERLFRWAWREALELPRGPVHLDLPADEASRRARGRGSALERERRPGPSPSAIRSAARLLARRGRVVVIVGMGCREPGPSRALQELVEHLGSPTLTTPRAKGTIPEDHPLSAGVFMGGTLEEELLGMAEAILAVGLDPVELLPRSWRGGQPVVALGEYRIAPRPYEVAGEVIADLPTALNALREGLPPGGAWGLANWAVRAGEFRTRARTLLAEASEGRGRMGMPPHRVVELAREIFPRETVATVDAGAHRLAAAAFWDCYLPKGYLCSSDPASPGYALPAAIAAKLVHPERPVVAFLGDGGFLRSVMEVATAAWRRLPLVAVVFVDTSLSLIRAQQEQRRYAPVGVSLGEMDIPKLAESLGALGTLVDDEEGLRSALKDAVGTTQPAIIAARVRPTGYRRMLEILRGKTGT